MPFYERVEPAEASNPQLYALPVFTAIAAVGTLFVAADMALISVQFKTMIGTNLKGVGDAMAQVTKRVVNRIVDSNRLLRLKTAVGGKITGSVFNNKNL